MTRVAVVHDYLTQRGGAERVVLAMLASFPGSTVYTSVYEPASTYAEFAHHDVRTSSLQRVGVVRRDPRRALPLLSRAFDRLAIDRDVDVVLCSSSGWAHGVRAPAGVPKLVYCHNPPRWLHQSADYLRDQALPVRAALRLLRPRLLRWDAAAARSATAYAANSTVVAARIAVAYGIEATVLPPPVGLAPDGPVEPVPDLPPGFLLTVSRARGYKNTELLHAAMRALPDERLVVVGGDSIGANVRGVRDVSDAQLRWLYANCSALLAVSEEDFGLTPLEANSQGRPALCLQAGGYLDTLNDAVSGLFVPERSVAAVVDAVTRSRAVTWDGGAIRAHADAYSQPAFAARLRAWVAAATGASG